MKVIVLNDGETFCDIAECEVWDVPDDVAKEADAAGEDLLDYVRQQVEVGALAVADQPHGYQLPYFVLRSRTRTLGVPPRVW
jgi:hypothetical protein